jgi:hypothetical protein
MPSYNKFIEIYTEKHDDYIEFCDHIFIISGLKVKSKLITKILKNTQWLKIWESQKVRQPCQICESNYGAITVTFDTVKDENQIQTETCIVCSDCYISYCEDEPMNQKVYRYNYHTTSKFHGKNSFKYIT